MLLEIITNTNFWDILFISLFLKKRGKKNLKPKLLIFSLIRCVSQLSRSESLSVVLMITRDFFEIIKFVFTDVAIDYVLKLLL